MPNSEILDLIAQRYSCRAFSDKPVPDDVLDAILTAGLHAPSAVNAQPWRLIVVTDKALIDEIDATGVALLEANDTASYDRTMGRGGHMLYNTPVIVLIARPVEVSAYPDLDCGILASHLVLAAASLGVNSCIAGMPRVLFAGPDGDALTKRLGIPDGYRFALSVMLGYAAGDAKPSHEIDPSKIIRV